MNDELESSVINLSAKLLWNHSFQDRVNVAAVPWPTCFWWPLCLPLGAYVQCHCSVSFLGQSFGSNPLTWSFSPVHCLIFLPLFIYGQCGASRPPLTHESQRAACRQQFSPSPMWIPGIQLGSSALVSSAFSRAVSLTLSLVCLLIWNLIFFSLFSFFFFFLAP